MGPGLVTWLNLILKDRVSNSGGSTLPEPEENQNNTVLLYSGCPADVLGAVSSLVQHNQFPEETLSN